MRALEKSRVGLILPAAVCAIAAFPAAAQQPAHRAFWFGWYAAYPATRLVK